MLHSFASLFLPQILAQRGDQIKGIILMNPAWEAIPGSGLEDMTDAKVPKDKPVLVIGSEFDQVMVPDHFEAWKAALKDAKDVSSVWAKRADHFLMTTDRIPDEELYMRTTGHVSEKAMTQIVSWVMNHWSDSE